MCGKNNIRIDFYVKDGPVIEPEFCEYLFDAHQSAKNFIGMYANNKSAQLSSISWGTYALYDQSNDLLVKILIN